MIATVVEVDLINYSEIAFRVQVELGLGAEGTSLLNSQLRRLVDEAVRSVKLQPEEIIKNKAGDGFILVFLDPDDAHRFSETLHRLCMTENKDRIHKSAHRWFRIGVATGDLYEIGNEIAGVSIIEAVRLERAATKGHVLIDNETYRLLTKVYRNEYNENSESVTDGKGKVHLVHRYKIELPDERSAGIVSPQELDASKQRMSDEVFAIELQTKPIRLERDRTGAVTVTVDRGKVEEMLISNEAKLDKTLQYVTPEKKRPLMELDRKIQAFLAKDGGEEEMEIDLQGLGICLRWASGGVLSIVTDTKGQQWVPLFFRDIRPYGWNIALGTTERWFDKKTGLLDETYNLKADLNSPQTFILREFLEESIVVTGNPQPGKPLIHKGFRFLNYNPPPFVENRATEFYKNHHQLRKDRDKLIVEEWPKHTKLTFDDPKCSLKVLSASGKEEKTSGVLVCFSLLDLGIEVVKVARYNLEDGDWILDGEIREKYMADTEKTEMELVRMPIALLSLNYLRNTFAAGDDWHRYTFGPQPSIKVPCAPVPYEEIKLFDWDVKRRMKVVEGEWGEKWHRDRFINWYDKFGSHFIKDRESSEAEWELTYDNPSQLFVPGAAKILNLYFSLVEGK